MPYDADVCPVCGMPTEEAFEDKDEPPAPSPDDTSALVSAIPPDPSKSPEPIQSLEERHRRLRLLVFATALALVVVGGGALFITRPWDPEAYSIHATEDADTSMEGFPGTLTHLPSQDHVEAAAWESYLGDSEAFLQEFYRRMGAMQQEIDLLYETLPGLFSPGDMATARDNDLACAKLSAELADVSKLATRLVLPETELDERRDTLLVVSSYQRGELDILAKAWHAASAEGDLTEAGRAASIALQRGTDSHDFNEWRNLFRNAYESETTRE